MSSSKCILVVEDHADIQLGIKIILSNYEVVVASNLDEAQKKVDHQMFDLILLDVNLPDGNGFKFCTKLQQNEKTKDTPVIFVTAESQVEDKVMGLTLGADDYITKPFDANELRARVEARLRKKIKNLITENIFIKGKLKFDILKQSVVLLAEKESKLDLTALEFKILLYFARHEGEVISRDQLIDTFWGKNVNVLDRTVDSHVSNLRKKIVESGYTIQSVYGAGYSFQIQK